MNRPYAYAHAPRLPPAGSVDIGWLTRQQTGQIEIEIGPGRGAFLLDRARECPQGRLVGLEVRWKWAAIVDERLAREGHGHRARVFAEDARLLLPRLEPDASVSAFFIHFPDPWWKRRQHKRLVVTSSALDHMARLLVGSGMLFLQTDVIERATAYDALVCAHGAFVPDGDEHGSAHLKQCPWTAMGNRERRAEQDGIPTVRMRYRRA